jgi:hypothetical protein
MARVTKGSGNSRFYRKWQGTVDPCAFGALQVMKMTVIAVACGAGIQATSVQIGAKTP